MDTYLVVGNPRTRKSSLVRSLSGCFNRNVRDIQLVGGGAPVQTYVRALAMQESRVTPPEAVVEAQQRRCQAALLCLWASAHPQSPRDYPSAADYIDHFETAGWRVRAVAILGQNAGGLRGHHVLQITQASVQPVNVTAHAVRLHFGWM